MLCPALEHLLSTFFNCLLDLDTSFASLIPIDKFMYILSANSHCKIIGKHLYNMYKTRSQLLNLYSVLAVILYPFLVTHRPNQAGHFACHSN